MLRLRKDYISFIKTNELLCIKNAVCLRDLLARLTCEIYMRDLLVC
ncbi:MAG: hypothetical protein LBG97_02840 [Coriobacteriales bacterium]|nr:hypothetical protein [Coriobacteriales bacterium]